MRRSFLFLMLIPALLLAIVPMAARAQNEPPPGTDIVFVVDQSGSMSRGTIINPRDRRCTPERLPDCPRSAPTDPDGLAIKAIRDGVSPIFERMILRSFSRLAEPTIAEENRFGLVLFGGDATFEESVVTALPLTPIQIERDTNGLLQSNIARQLPTTPRSLGETAFSRAFTGVCTLLDCAQPTPANRKRVVVLLTDGQPSQDEIAFDTTKPERYFDQLSTRHADLFSNSELWVLGLDTKDQFWSKNAPYWSKIAPGRTFHLTNPKDIAARFRAIAQRSVGDPPGIARDCDGSPIVIEPYRSTLTLILEYADSNSRAVFVQPDQSELTKQLNLLGYTRSAQSETFVIKDPAPGEWHCKIVGSSVTPRYRAIVGEFRLAEAKIEQLNDLPVSTCQTFDLAVSYRDADGAQIAQLPGVTLDQTLAITINGQLTTRNLVPDGDARQRWRTDQPLMPGARGGAYPARVETRLPDGTLLLQSTEQLVTIDAQLPCMQSVAPGGLSQMYTGLALTPVELAVQLTQGGQPSFPKDVFKEDLAQIVGGQLADAHGVTQTIQLQPDAARPGTFIARLDDLQSAGVYTFTASLNATTPAGQAYQLAPQSVSFSRVADPYWVSMRWAIRIAALLALIGVIALLGYLLFLITGPFPRGTLVLEQRRVDQLAEIGEWDKLTYIRMSSQRMLFGLFRTRRPSVKSSALKAMSLREIKIRRVARGKDEGVQVTLIRADRKGTLAFQLIRDKEQKTFDGKYRITYETYGLGRKGH
ncbi:MAG: vWA domain-containing protein [Roseiflexaceae bacterium]